MNKNHHDSYSNRNTFKRSLVTKVNDQQSLIQQRESAVSTANENKKPATINGSVSHHDEEYPTSKTIPFPFSSGPYPQQAALMDAILSTLKLVDESHTDSLSDNGDDAGGSKSEGGIASVMLLESPTGTGKSLSLACSALAWLRYRERQDLLAIKKEKQCNNCSETKENDYHKNDTSHGTTSAVYPNINPSKVDDTSDNHQNCKTTTSTTIDWLDAWTSSELQEKQETQRKLQSQCYDRATSSRNALNTQLNTIRHRIRTSISKSSIVNGSGKRDGENKDITAIEVRKIRDQIAKMEIESLHQEEGSQRRRINEKSHGKGREVSNHNSTVDFCLDDYHSDDDQGTIRTDFQENSLYDMDDGEEGFDNSGIDSQVTKKVKSSFNGKHDAGKKVASELIDGGQLDGSGQSGKQSHTKKNNGSKSSPNNISMVSVGNVRPGSGMRKIVYSARTHSQLSQFVDEIRRTAWGQCQENTVRVVSLGGRKLLCGNRDVTGFRRKNNEKWITEKCLDMQKGKSDRTAKQSSEDIVANCGQVKMNRRGSKRKSSSTEQSKKCPLMQSKEARSSLALHMLAQPSDIEDLSSLGLSTQTCAYYASRESLAGAEVVVVPYNILLSKQARESVGLSLQQSLVIIDEAHNIPEALRSLSSCRLTLSAIEGANSQLAAYTQRYGSRLNGRNLFYLGQIRRFLMTTSRYLKKRQSMNSTDDIITSTELLFRLKLDNINLFNVIRYLETSKLANKLLGFNNTIMRATAEKQTSEQIKQDCNSCNEDESATFTSKHISSMSIVESFMKCLNGGQKEGRVMIGLTTNNNRHSVDRVESEPYFHYLLLSPSIQFRHVLEEAYAVCLAGGTLAPFQHVTTELFGDFDDNKLLRQLSIVEKDHQDISISKSLTTFTCGHVIPPENAMTLTLCYGVTGSMELDFRHSSRSDNLADELGKTLLKICGVVPSGIVIFFPSYAYEGEIALRWIQTGMYDHIRKIKKIYREPKKAGDIESTLKLYSKDARSRKGACLLAVIGGRLSEGINFSGPMARCVVVVGVPYPNPTDPELREKMQLLDANQKKQKSLITGKAYYHNLCMRAINQSIGRAIRNVSDYAAIILADTRYSSNMAIRSGLPKWLNVKENHSKKSFQDNLRNLQIFFKCREKEKSNH